MAVVLLMAVVGGGEQPGCEWAGGRGGCVCLRVCVCVCLGQVSCGCAKAKRRGERTGGAKDESDFAEDVALSEDRN